MTTERSYPSKIPVPGHPHGFESSYPPNPEPLAQQESVTGLAAVVEEERLSWAQAADLLVLTEQAFHDGVTSCAYPAIRPGT